MIAYNSNDENNDWYSGCGCGGGGYASTTYSELIPGSYTYLVGGGGAGGPLGESGANGGYSIWNYGGAQDVSAMGGGGGDFVYIVGGSAGTDQAGIGYRGGAGGQDGGPWGNAGGGGGSGGPNGPGLTGGLVIGGSGSGKGDITDFPLLFVDDVHQSSPFCQYQ